MIGGKKSEKLLCVWGIEGAFRSHVTSSYQKHLQRGKQIHGPFLAPYFMCLIRGKDAEDAAKVERELYLPYLVIRPVGNPVMALVGKNELLEAGRYELWYLIWCCVCRKY